MGGPVPRTPAESAAIPYYADAGVGVASGFTAAFTAAPFIMTVDKAVTQASAGTTGLWTAVGAGLKEIALRPHHLLRNPALLMVGAVYGLTYMTANLIDVVCERALDPTVRADRPNALHRPRQRGPIRTPPSLRDAGSATL